MTYATAAQKLALIPEQYLDEVCSYLDNLSCRITNPSAMPRTPGLMKGNFYMLDDFDEPLEAFEAYM